MTSGNPQDGKTIGHYRVVRRLGGPARRAQGHRRPLSAARR